MTYRIRRLGVSGVIAGVSAGVLVLLAAASHVFSPPAEIYTPPPAKALGWRTRTDPEFLLELGLNPDKVAAFGRYNLSVENSHVEGHDYGFYKGALVVRNGWIVGEWYNRGDGRDYRHYLSSVGKSVALAAFGVLQKDRENGNSDIPSSADPLYDPRWLPQGFPLSDPRKADITFDQVFRHESGITPETNADGVAVETGRYAWGDKYEEWVVGHYPENPSTQRLYFDPGYPEQYEGSVMWGNHRIAYSSVAFAHLGLVFSTLSGIPAHRFLEQRLFTPLGIGFVAYHRWPTRRIRWFSAAGVRMTTRDFARLALFFMEDGKWDGKRLTPPGWIASRIASAKYPNLRGNADGYFGEQYPADMFRLWGSGGNIAFVVPSMNFLALRTGRVSNLLFEPLQRDFLRRMFEMVESSNP